MAFYTTSPIYVLEHYDTLLDHTYIHHISEDKSLLEEIMAKQYPKYIPDVERKTVPKTYRYTQKNGVVELMTLRTLEHGLCTRKTE
jgi:hypothetical protein